MRCGAVCAVRTGITVAAAMYGVCAASAELKRRAALDSGGVLPVLKLNGVPHAQGRQWDLPAQLDEVSPHARGKSQKLILRSCCT